MSLAGTSAPAESVFSAGGLIDTPRRNRLDPRAVEQLLVVYQYITMGHVTIERFYDQINEKMGDYGH